MIPTSREESDSSHQTGRLVPANGLFQTVALGAKGGFVATFVMTAFRLPISHSLPPTDEFWAKYVRRDNSGGHLVPAILLHVLYGMLAGIVYVLAVPGPSNTAEVDVEKRGVVAGVAYSLVLSVFGHRVVLGQLLGQDLSPDEEFVFHLGHVIYGITLGVWTGSRTAN